MELTSHISNIPTLRIGLIAIARTTFDITLAAEVAQTARQHLQTIGEVFGPDALVTDLSAALDATAVLTQAPLNLLVILQATFADSTMVMSIAQAIEAPLLLWAVPEERTGGRLRLNSLCGVNLAAHALKRNGVRYHYVYSAPGDQSALHKAQALAQAGCVRRQLKTARIGRVGQHPDGFETCIVNDAALARLGVEIQQIELAQVFDAMRSVSTEATTQRLQAVSQRVSGIAELGSTATHGTLSAYEALHCIAQRDGLNGLAVRCWPEFFTEMGCAACGALSLLSDSQTPSSGEADVNGTITQLILQGLSGEPAFGADLVSVDAHSDTAVLWHCGQAPLSMADPDFQPRGTLHSNRKLPLLFEFPLKPGRVTLARLSEATGEMCLVIGRGEMQRSERLSFSGTSGVLRFDRPAADVLDTILSEGLEHHLSLTYGDHIAALLALADMLEMPVLRL
jgi:L-fucose isomerase-like protein